MVGLLLGFLLLPGFLLGLLPGFGFGLLRIGELLVGRLLVGELGIIVRLGLLVCLVGLGLRLVRRFELRLGFRQLPVGLLEVLLGVLQTLDGVLGVVELAGGRVEVVLRLRVCGLGVGDGLVGGLDLLVGGFNLRVGNGLGFKRGLLGLLGLGLRGLGVGQVGCGLRLVRVGLLDRGFRIRLGLGGGLGQLVGGIDLRLCGGDRRVRLVHCRLGCGLGGGGGGDFGPGFLGGLL